MERIFYRPDSGVSADYIPYYENGVFYLFYLRDYRAPATRGEGTPWFLVTTTDFVHFTEHGEVLPRGTEAEQDLYVFTGCVTKMGGRYHIHYTGHNPHLRARGLPEQAVMHAVSDDLLHWHKCPQDTFFAPEGYERHDWRDPLIWYEPERQRYRMLLAARCLAGASRRRGVTAQCHSSDGVHWQTDAPFYAPGAYYTHECPDLFRIGEWYYLLFSEFSQEHVTRYRISRDPNGPWRAPADDRLDSCAYYAAKTAASEAGRFLFGWIATREGETDDGWWQWGGCLAVHQLLQRPDGTLRAVMPPSLARRFAAQTSAELTLDGTLALAAQTVGQLPSCCGVTCVFRVPEARGKASLALAADEALAEGYFLTLDMDRRRLLLDRWPRTVENGMEPGMERPLPPTADGTYRLRVLVDGSAACAYLNDEIAMCFRLYDRAKPYWGVLAENTALTAQCGLCAPDSRNGDEACES